MCLNSTHSTVSDLLNPSILNLKLSLSRKIKCRKRHKNYKLFRPKLTKESTDRKSWECSTSNCRNRKRKDSKLREEGWRCARKISKLQLKWQVKSLNLKKKSNTKSKLYSKHSMKNFQSSINKLSQFAKNTEACLDLQFTTRKWIDIDFSAKKSFSSISVLPWNNWKKWKQKISLRLRDIWLLKIHTMLSKD